VQLDGQKVFKTSAVTGAGIDDLRAAILEQVTGNSAPGEQESGFLTNVRHQRLVEESLQSLEAASHAVKHSIPHEMIMLDLYSALRPLDAVTGETTTDDILNLIFSSFCIGK
jgi:tRNA modification GTPase